MSNASVTYLASHFHLFYSGLNVQHQQQQVRGSVWCLSKWKLAACGKNSLFLEPKLKIDPSEFELEFEVGRQWRPRNLILFLDPSFKKICIFLHLNGGENFSLTLNKFLRLCCEEKNYLIIRLTMRWKTASSCISWNRWTMRRRNLGSWTFWRCNQPAWIRML